MAAPKTVLTYPLNGALKDFAIPFEYLARKFVVVTLIGATRRVLTLNSEYRFTTKKQVTTTTAWGPTQGFDLIEVRRVTSATERLVDFSDGSILRAYDLNTAQVQSLHIAEEARDLTADTIGVNNNGDLDARGRRIVNLADGVADGDAVNLRQQKTWAGSALNQAEIARQQAVIATANAVEAGVRKDVAGQYRDQSAASASASETSRVGSSNFAVHSENKSKESAASAVTAKNEADRAATNNSQSLTNNQQSYQNLVSATAQADRAKTEADRAKDEADKLGNMNVFAGTIESVTATQVTWKAPYTLAATQLFANSISPKTAGQPVRIASASLTVDGNITAAGSADIGTSVQIKAPTAAANAHVWFREPNGVTERALMYADSAGSIHFRTKEQADTLLLGANRAVAAYSTFTATGRITSTSDILSYGNVYSGQGNAYLATDGNVYGGVWGGWLSNWVHGGYLPRAEFGPNWVEWARNRTVHDLGAYCLCLAHNNSGTEWNDLVAGGNLTGTHTGGQYYAGYTMPGTWRRMGKLADADGGAPNSTTIYVRLA